MKSVVIYPGWQVMIGSFICAALAIGFTSYIFGMFTVPVTEEFDIPRATFNNGMIGLLVGGMIASPVIGKLLDRYPVRRIVVACALAFCAALVVTSRTNSLWLMLVMITLPLAFGAAGCGVLAANTVTVRWFRRRRGRALGVVALSTSVGGFFAQPVTALLIDTFGWRDALLMIGVAPTAIFLLMAALLIRDRPTEATPGYQAEFEAVVEQTEEEAAAEQPWTTQQLLRSRNFWLVAIGIGLLFGIDQAVLVSQVAYFQDIGYDLQTTALLVSVKTISAIGGKLLIGYLADKVDLRIVFAYVAGSGMLLLGVYILQPAFWLLLPAIALLGIAVGGVFPAWSTINAWLFGARSYGSVMGLMAIIMQPFAIVTMRFIGQVYDRTGSYIPAFGLFIALALCAMVLIFFVRPERRGDVVTAAGTAQG
jgi:MFS family permease